MLACNRRTSAQDGASDSFVPRDGLIGGLLRKGLLLAAQSAGTLCGFQRASWTASMAKGLHHFPALTMDLRCSSGSPWQLVLATILRPWLRCELWMQDAALPSGVSQVNTNGQIVLRPVDGLPKEEPGSCMCHHRPIRH